VGGGEEICKGVERESLTGADPRKGQSIKDSLLMCGNLAKVDLKNLHRAPPAVTERKKMEEIRGRKLP